MTNKLRITFTCIQSEQTNRPLAISWRLRILPSSRYAPINNLAGPITRCFMSLVDQIKPASRSRVSSDNPGKVLDEAVRGPFATPLVKFFSISLYNDKLRLICRGDMKHMINEDLVKDLVVMSFRALDGGKFT
jgi:hypothetical protein